MIIQNLDIQLLLVEEDVTPLIVSESGWGYWGIDSSFGKKEFLSVHLMDSWECLQHPDFRRNSQYLIKKYLDDFTPIVNTSQEADLSIVSLELWTFMSSFFDQKIEAYDLIYSIPVYIDNMIQPIISEMRKGATNQIGNLGEKLFNDYGKLCSATETETLYVYFRLLQALFFLRTGKFIWDSRQLFDDSIVAKQILQKDNISPETIKKDLAFIIEEINLATKASSLPDKVPAEIQSNLLRIAQNTRSIWV